MTQPAVPFYILCGSLGAGKTTLLMRLLEHWKRRGIRAGVLMNEAGEISIDGPRVGTIAEQVMNLAGGCVCCDTKEDLSWGIAQLVREYRSELIVLECSGLADPAEVVDGVTDLYTARLARLERIIALLQPITNDQSPSSTFVTEQAIRYADELILNKRDLYVPGHWEQFKASIVARNAHARVWETTHARIDAAALLGGAWQLIQGGTHQRRVRQIAAIFAPARGLSSDGDNGSITRNLEPGSLFVVGQNLAKGDRAGQRLSPLHAGA